MLLSDLPAGCQNDKFHGRLISDESSGANSSFRVYYGVAPGPVPFLWESQPGTPKHPSAAAASLPPLTPPPSYFSAAAAVSRRSKPAAVGFIRAVLPKLRLRKVDTWPSSSVSSSASSSSSSSRSGDRRCLTSSLLSCAGGGGEGEDDSDDGSPSSTLCSGGFRGSRPAPPMRKASLSVIGGGSGCGASR